MLILIGQHVFFIETFHAVELIFYFYCWGHEQEVCLNNNTLTRLQYLVEFYTFGQFLGLDQ